MHGVLFAPRAMLFGLEFLLYTADILMRVVIYALAVRASETN